MADAFHFSVNIISRGKGKSAVASAAYISGEKITNEWDGITHDYRRKQGVIYKDILLPEHVPNEFKDRSKLWNSIELFEKNSNAQLARNFIIALPKELSLEENKELIKKYIEENLLSQGMIVDYAIHSESNEGNQNIHAHIMTIVRPIDEHGMWKAKSRKEYVLDENGDPVLTKSGAKKSRKIELTTWNDRGNVEKWRESFSDLCNEYLEKSGQEKRVDHRSFKRQDIDQIPTVHMGAAASSMERKGIPTEKGNINREIKKQNGLIKSIKKEIKRLTEWLEGFSDRLQASLDRYKEQKKSEIENKPELFDLYEYLSFYQEMQTKESHHLKYYAKQNKNLYDLKKFSQGILYLRENNLKTIADLQSQIDTLKTKNRKNFKSIKSKTERIETLNQCLKYGEIIETNAPVYDEYQSKKLFKENFYKENQQAIDKYERARNQIKNRVGSSAVKANEWQSEIKKLEQEIQTLNNSSMLIKDEYQQINHIKYAVDHVNKEYGIDLSIEIDKAIKRGDKPSVIKQIHAFQEQQQKDEQYRQKAKDKNQER